MTTLDIILTVIIFFFVATGIRFGFIVTLGSLVGTVIGAVVAGMFFEQGAEWLAQYISNANLANVVSFIIIFTITSRLTGVVFWLINKMFIVVSIIPFIASINRLAGGFLGLLEGVVVIGFALLFIDKFPFSDTVIPAVNASQVAQYIISYTSWLAPLLPEAVRTLESHIMLPPVVKDFVDGALESATTTLESSIPIE